MNKKGRIVQQRVSSSAHTQSADTVGSQSASTAQTVTDTQTNAHSLPSLMHIQQQVRILN